MIPVLPVSLVATACLNLGENRWSELDLKTEAHRLLAALSAEGAHIYRITSYNVCYTKLLRIVCGRATGAPQRADAGTSGRMVPSFSISVCNFSKPPS